MAAKKEETKLALKDGYKTTEFWLTTVAMLVSIVFASGLVTDGTTVEKVLSFVAMALTSLGYSVSRGLAKK